MRYSRPHSHFLFLKPFSKRISLTSINNNKPVKFINNNNNNISSKQATKTSSSSSKSSISTINIINSSLNNISSLKSIIYLPVRSKKAVYIEELKNFNQRSSSQALVSNRLIWCDFFKRKARIGSIQLATRLNSIKRTLVQINVNTVELLTLLLESNIRNTCCMIHVSKTNELIT